MSERLNFTFTLIFLFKLILEMSILLNLQCSFNLCVWIWFVVWWLTNWAKQYNNCVKTNMTAERLFWVLFESYIIYADHEDHNIITHTFAQSLRITTVKQKNIYTKKRLHKLSCEKTNLTIWRQQASQTMNEIWVQIISL